MHKTLTAVEIRSQFSQCLTHVMMTNTRLLIVRNGRDTAALVSIRDLDALEDVDTNSEAFVRARLEHQMKKWQALKAGLDG